MVLRNVCGVNALDNGYAPVVGPCNGPLNLTKARDCVYVDDLPTHAACLSITPTSFSSPYNSL